MPTKTLWISPTDWVTGDPTLSVTYPSVQHPVAVFTTTMPGASRWVFVGLRLPVGNLIQAVRVCYQLSNSQSFISRVRLIEVQAPDRTVVRHNDGTDLRSTEATCYVSKVGDYLPEGAVTLAFRLEFADQADQITIGPVGIDLESGELGDANVKYFGAVGDGISDDTPAIVAASRAAIKQGGSVVFPPGRYRMVSESASDLTIRAPTVFGGGALLQPDANTTIILKGAITAPPEPIFDGSAGGHFRVDWDGEVYANWWAGEDIGERWNNMLKACRNGPRKLRVVGVHMSFTGLDATSLKRGEVLDFSGSRITFRMNGGVALDMTGSIGVTLNEPYFVGYSAVDQLDEADLPPALIPDVGILLSRDEETNPASPQGSNRHILNSAWVDGYWKLAALYNIGSEVNRHNSCLYKNASPAGRYAAFFGKTNRDGVTSAFDVTPGNGTPSTTAAGQELYGTQILGHRCTEAAMYVWGFSHIVYTSGFITSGENPYIVLDSTPGPMFSFRATELHCHHSPEFGWPPSGIDIKRENSFEVTAEALDALRSAALAETVLERLNLIKDELIIGRQTFLDRLRDLIGDEASTSHAQLILGRVRTNHRVDDLYISALSINVKGEPPNQRGTAIRIGDVTLHFAHLEWSDTAGLDCDPGCEIRDGLIRALGAARPMIKLGREFSGQIVMGTSDQLTKATDSMRGTVLFTVPEETRDKDRLHHYSPATFEKRTKPPCLENGQAVLWLSSETDRYQDGDIVLTVRDSNGIQKSVVLADFSTLPEDGA